MRPRRKIARPCDPSRATPPSAEMSRIPARESDHRLCADASAAKRGEEGSFRPSPSQSGRPAAQAPAACEPQTPSSQKPPGRRAPEPAPKGRAPWESQVVLQAGRARRRSRAAGLWRARRPPAPPSRHPHKTREGHPAFAQMAAPAFAKAPPPAGGRAIRHPSDASRACIRARPDQTTERVRQMGTAARNARPTFDDISRSRAERTAAGSAAYPGGMTVRVSYAGEVTLEEAVSHYLAARQNAMEAIGPAKASA